MSWLDDWKGRPAAEAVAEAERLLDEAERISMDRGRPALGLALKGNQLRTLAAKAMPPSREKLDLLLEILFTADALEDQDRMVWAVREAVKLDPTEEERESLEDYWECSAWVLKGDKSFPEPPGEAERPHRPATNQSSFLEAS